MKTIIRIMLYLVIGFLLGMHYQLHQSNKSIQKYAKIIDLSERNNFMLLEKIKAYSKEKLEADK